MPMGRVWYSFLVADQMNLYLHLVQWTIAILDYVHFQTQKNNNYIVIDCCLGI